MKDNRFRDIPRVAYLLLITIAIVNLGILLLAPEIIKIFAPEEYYDAVWVMPPIILAVFFMFMYNLFACFEFYYEKKTYVSIATMIGAALNILLNLIFIQKFGYMAAGYTTLVCYIAFAFMHYFFMKKICKKNLSGLSIYKSKILFAISIIYLGIGVLIVFTYTNTILRYAIVAIGAVAIIVFRRRIFAYMKRIINLNKTEEKE